MNTQIIPIQDIERMAVAMSGSGLFGMKTKEQAVALMLIAQAEGLHPAIAARDYHIIDGKPALKADAMLARFISGGGKVEWHEHTNEKVSATFSHPSGGSIVVDWDIARAKAAGLAGKQNWNKYPRQMLRARVISEGVRAVYPVANSGLYTPEEVQDFSNAPQINTIEGEVTTHATISEQQEADIKALMEDVQANVPAFLGYFKIGKVGELYAEHYETAVKMLEAKRKKA